MNLPSSQFLRLVQPHPTTVSSPKIDLIVQAWDHIAARYLRRLDSNRSLSGRVRSLRLLAVHDAIQSVVDPGNSHLYHHPSEGSTIEAASAAAVRASHDLLAAVFDAAEDRADLRDLLEESLDLIPGGIERTAGEKSGADSAQHYLQNFSTLLKSPVLPDRVSWNGGWFQGSRRTA